MSSRPKIKDRSTSLAGAFVHAIIPRSADPGARKRLFEFADINENECVYCGAKRTDWDHFRSLVKKGLPSGYFHTSRNLVPSCGPCNQSKGGRDWKLWILGSAKGSPSKRSIPGLERRVERLAAFAESSDGQGPSLEQMRSAVGVELWDRYWGVLETIKDKMNEADILAKQVRERMEGAFSEPVRSENST